ncbi:MAG: ferrous iron transport protein A [Atopobiaceae bacterium]|nr:ferrous iron transport protein A [Atopobiaceae bacterium]MCH4120021.1 ferrous iron transport protein A [Atopobiaceae bacterium]MCI1318667.1 ferrous iron transport protein A [Atopobiaceae bacterium]MCI1389380.1 ferrous iron transport protein A [Atopobiaceae bacterium]MCI1432443.1 ferrous iron transport protein A [Atopobiaceae bacterium]
MAGTEAKVRTLRDVPVGDSCTVSKLNGTGALKRRIMDMGLTKGTRVRVRKVAPLGDPVELSVRGYELSIRKYEADSIEVVDVRSDKD